MLAALLSRKLVQVRVNGRVWLADSTTFEHLERENPGLTPGLASNVDVARPGHSVPEPQAGVSRNVRIRVEDAADVGAGDEVEIGGGTEGTVVPRVEVVAADLMPRVGLFSYNARMLSGEELGRTFVPHPAYPRLASNSHTLLVGPRGSGRTTLLRMLTPKAQAASQAPIVRAVAAQMSYIPVWIDSSVAQVRHPDSTIQALLFTSEVLRTLVKAGRERVGLTGASQVEYEVASRISQIMEIEGEISTFEDLDRELGSLKTNLMLARDSGEIRTPADMMLLAQAAIEVFNSALGVPDQRWCLIFDELELANWEITAQVFAAMRTSDPTLIVKAAMLPQSDPRLSDSQLGPSAGMDFELLDLRRPPSDRSFIAELARQRIEAHGIADPEA